MEKEIEGKKKLNILAKILIVIILIIGLLYFWMHFFEPKIIMVKDFILTNEKIPKRIKGA